MVRTIYEAPRVLKHDIAKVRSIIKDFQEARLLVPEFQREYVWRGRRVALLIDSLYHSFPISSLLVWDSEDYNQVRRREPHQPLRAPSRLLIDGQQRVTTLANIMCGDEDVVFNVDTEKFSRPNPATKYDPHWVRVTDVWNDDEYRRYRRTLPDDDHGRRVEEHLERLRSVLDYEIPVVCMVGGFTIEETSEAFTRVNSLGVPLKGINLDSARLAAKHLGFIREQLIPFLQLLKKRGFERLSATHLFRVCAFLAQPDGRKSIELHKLERCDLEKAWRRTKVAVNTALDLIAGELGIADMSVLWSGSLLVPVIALCDLPVKARNDREIAGWVALAAFWHRYSQASQTALEQDLRACRATDPIGALLANLKQRRAFLGAYETDFDGTIADRSSLLATYIACRHLGARDLVTTGTVQGSFMIDRHHILPRAHFAPEHRYRADALANIAFIRAGSNKFISDANVTTYLSRIDPAVLKSHAIPTDKSLWDVERADEFWAKRRELLARAFNDYLKSVLPKRRLSLGE